MDSRLRWNDRHLHPIVIPAKAGIQKLLPELIENLLVLLDRITETGDEIITGERRYYNDPAYLGIESLAQLGAYHVRFINDFEIHAFLLKIGHCRVIGSKILHGEYLIDGRLIN